MGDTLQAAQVAWVLPGPEIPHCLMKYLYKAYKLNSFLRGLFLHLKSCSTEVSASIATEWSSLFSCCGELGMREEGSEGGGPEHYFKKKTFQHRRSWPCFQIQPHNKTSTTLWQHVYPQNLTSTAFQCHCCECCWGWVMGGFLQLHDWFIEEEMREWGHLHCAHKPIQSVLRITASLPSACLRPHG